MSCLTGRTSQGCGGNCENAWREKFEDIIIYKHHGPYQLGFKYCKVCDISVKTDLVRCVGCCHQLMRSRKRS